MDPSGDRTDVSSGEPLTGGAATRQRIVEVAHRLARDVGLRRLTMRNVAQLAELSRAALYRHFPDKPSLIEAVLRYNGRLVRTGLDRALDEVDSLADKCVAAARFGLLPASDDVLLELRRSDPESFAQLLTNDSLPFLERAIRYWTPHVEAAKRSGEIRNDVPVPAAAEWIVRCLYGLAVTPTVTFDRQDASAIDWYIRSFVMTGLGAAPPPSPPAPCGRE